MHSRRMAKLRAMFVSLAPPVRFLELGCGGHPELRLADCWTHYTGVDFSATGLKVATAALQAADIDHRVVQADITHLPFGDATFDAVYCAHVLYHIDHRDGQRQALHEAMRVLRPGGIAVFIIANPFPLLFPLRSGRRMIAALPILGNAFARVRAAPPLPYLPLRRGWYRRQLSPFGRVAITTFAIHSTWFNQNVSEFNIVGGTLWRTLGALELCAPRVAALLGNYALIHIERS